MIQRDSKTTGLGVIELIVAIVVSGIVLAGIATIFARSWQTQDEVISVTEATNRGQFVAAAIERAVRNGLYMEVADGGTILRVSTSLTGTRKCQAFQLSSSSGGTTRFATSGSVLGDPSTWPEWHTQLIADGVSPVFDDSSPGLLVYRFQIDTESAPVRFAGEVSPRSTQEGNHGGCW